MTMLLRGLRLITDGGPWPVLKDIALSDGCITAVEPTGVLPDEGEVIDMDGALVLPGHVNAHAHNHELYLKGTGWGLPLEPYILANSPHAPLGSGLDDDALYDRTLASAHEMIRNGITSVADDVIHPRMTPEAVSAVLRAYDDSGMRATVSLMVEDSPWRRSIPLRGAPADFDATLDRPPHTPEHALALYRDLFEQWAHSTRVQLMVSPSAPQRCSPQFLHQLVGLAREYNARFHVHIQETLAQRAHGPALFGGRSMIRFMFDEDLLGPETMIAHAIWIDDADIAAIAEAGATVVHNPVSNVKLGSGVARVRDLLDAGVNVALGTDGLTCNDALDMFEVSKAAATLSCLASTEPQAWLTPSEVLTAATRSGARAIGRPDDGTITPGGAADLTFLDPASYSFVPHNDVISQTIYSARSRDVTDVMVAGRFLLRDGRHADPSVADTKRRVVAAADEFWTEARPSLIENHRLQPYVDAAYAEAVKTVASDPATPYRLIPPVQR